MSFSTVYFSMAWERGREGLGGSNARSARCAEGGDCTHALSPPLPALPPG